MDKYFTFIQHYIRRLSERYHNYHNQDYSIIVNWLLLTICLLIIFISSSIVLLSPQSSAKTTITQIIYPRNIGIQLPDFLTFSSIISSIDRTQVSTAILRGLTVTNYRRGENIEWSLTATCTDFYMVNQPFLLKGDNNTLSSSGSYNQPIGGSYIVTIISDGPVGTAAFKVTGLEEDSDKITGNNVQIGTRGIFISFAPAAYKTGDSWLIRVDTIPVSNMTMTPLSFTGAGNDIYSGEEHRFTDRNDTAAILMSKGIQSLESISTDIKFTLKIPPFTYANSYTATLTVTTN